MLRSQVAHEGAALRTRRITKAQGRRVALVNRHHALESASDRREQSPSPQLRPRGLGLAHDVHDSRVARIGRALGRANSQGRLAVDRAEITVEPRVLVIWNGSPVR